jgi:hypothetical protein
MVTASGSLISAIETRIAKSERRKQLDIRDRMVVVEAAFD